MRRPRPAPCVALLNQICFSRSSDQAAQQPADVLLLRGLRLDPVADLLLLLAHVADQGLNALGEARHRRRALALVLRIGRRRPCARAPRRRGAGLRLDMAGEKILQLGVEAVLRLPRLQIEEAEDQRAGEAEQRGGERNAHAGDRRRQAALEIVEHRRRVGAGLHAVDDAADRMHGLQQAPERAEQAEKHQQADEIAVEFAPLVEPGADRIEDRAGRRGRKPARAGAGVQHRRHRGEQQRRARRRASAAGVDQRIHPADFAEKPEHLPEGEHRADQSTPMMSPLRPGLAANASAIDL